MKKDFVCKCVHGTNEREKRRILPRYGYAERGESVKMTCIINAYTDLCSFSFEQDIIFDTQFLFHIIFGVFLRHFFKDDCLYRKGYKINFVRAKANIIMQLVTMNNR